MQITNALVLKAKQEFWHRSDLSYKLHESQKLINDSYKNAISQLFVSNCSRQLGKTYWAVTKALEVANRIPNAQIRYGAAFHSDLIDFIIPAFEKALEDCPEALKPKYKTSGSQWVFPNGSRIKLVGLDKNPNGLRGNTLDLIVLDECGFVSNLRYIYESVIIPATTHRPNAKIILISTPPSTPAHPFVDFCQRAELEGNYQVFTIFDNPKLTSETILRLMKETGCIIPEDNPSKVIEAINSIRKTKLLLFPEDWIISNTFRREYLCEFITDQDLQIIPEWKNEYIEEIKPDEFYPYYHRYVGMDLGVKDFTALIFGYYDFKNATLVIEDEFRMNGPSMNTELLANAIKEKESEIWGNTKAYRRISDNNNPHLLQDLRTLHQLTFQATNKSSLEAMINEVRLLVQAGRIKIHPRCTQLIGCLKYGVWNTKKTEFARSNVYGHFDSLAALIYLVRNLSKNTNPIPNTHNLSVHTHHIPNSTDQTNTREFLKLLKKN